MALSWCNLPRVIGNLRVISKYPLVSFVRKTSNDYARTMIGLREIVGYGWNGSPVYQDRVDYPFPAIRFSEETVEICRLREKEKCDWNDLKDAEIKKLYRFSFCQTFAEMNAPTAEWKLAVGWGFWSIALAFMYYYLFYTHISPPYPVSFTAERKAAQLKRAIALELEPIDGLASWWDYRCKRWK